MQLKYIAAIAGLCTALGTIPASAMPVDNLSGKAAVNAESVRWICSYRHCWWRPGPRVFAFYPRHHRFYGPRFHRRHHWY